MTRGYSVMWQSGDILGFPCPTWDDHVMLCNEHVMLCNDHVMIMWWLCDAMWWSCDAMWCYVMIMWCHVMLCDDHVMPCDDRVMIMWWSSDGHVMVMWWSHVAMWWLCGSTTYLPGVTSTLVKEGFCLWKCSDCKVDESCSLLHFTHVLLEVKQEWQVTPCSVVAGKYQHHFHIAKLCE